MKKRRMFVVWTLGLTLVGAACGRGEEESATGPAEAIPVYTVTATEPSADRFEFAVPDNMRGGVITIRLMNEGKRRHDFQLVKAAQGHTLDELLKLVRSDNAPLEPWLVAAGGPSAAPGKTGEVTLDLEPGTYWYLSTQSGEGEGAKSDSELGMNGELTLEGESGADFPVAAPASILASDYAFKLDGFEAGANTIAFRNAGQQLHHALFFPLLPGKTIDDAKKAFLSEGQPSGPPPVDFAKAVGTTIIGPGQTMIVHLELEAGSYAVACFIPDKGTAGPPHAAKGMLAELKVE